MEALHCGPHLLVVANPFLFCLVLISVTDMSGANSSEDLKNPKLMFDVEQAHGSSNASHIKKQGPGCV